jgi:quinol monooxygenase YgiN
VAIHHPTADQADAMVDRVRAAAEVMSATPGCLEATCWRESGGAVVTIGKWVSDDALNAAFAAVTAAGVDFEYDERESRPREVLRIVNA